MTDVELVKSKIDIVDYLSEFITLKKTGRNFKANCPFHNEKSPSFIVSPERQSWHCFGACSEGGDVIAYLMKWENLEFIEALKILADKVGITLSNRSGGESVQLKEKLYQINSLACEFFHYLLTGHKLGKRALDYLSERGIKKAAIKTFKLGYAPESWDSLLKFLHKKGYSTADISTAGLLVKSEKGTYYDRFRGRLIFTLHDHRGNIVGFSGRTIPADGAKDEAEEKAGAKYVNTSETPVYTKGNVLYGLNVTREAIKKENKAIVVEGEFDLLSSFQCGVSNIVAIKGSAFTEGQTLLLRRFTENVVLALDADFAGSEAIRRGIEMAENAGLMLKVARLPYGKDPAECISKSPHLWKEAVEKAVSIYDFVIHSALEKYDKKEIEGKKKIGDEVVPYLAKITNPIVQSHYIKLLSSELLVNEDSILSSIQKHEQRGKLKDLIPDVSPKTKREELLEEHLLSLITQSEKSKEMFSESMTKLELNDLGLPTVKKIMEVLDRYFKKHEKLDVKKLGMLLSPEITSTFDKAYLRDIDNILSTVEHFNKELKETIFEIKKNSLRRKLNETSTKIRWAENEDKEEVFKEYHEKQRQMLKELNDLEKSYNRT